MVSSLVFNNFLVLLSKRDVDFGRIWGKNALGKPTGLAIKNVTSSSAVTSKTQELLRPLKGSDVDYFTVPDPDTYITLPQHDGEHSSPPLGAMFTDVYKVSDEKFTLHERGKDVRDLSDLERGITGPGVEFFFDRMDEDECFRHRGLNVPYFRDNLTPSLPKSTIKALFQYEGDSSIESKSPGADKERPTLKSAI